MFTRKRMEDLGRLDAATAKEHPCRPIILVLDDVRSMHNVGSAFRTADAFRVDSLYLCGYTPTPPHRDIRKTALGAEETVTWKHFDTIGAALQDVIAQGYTVVAVEQAEGSIALQEFSWDKRAPLALVFGNEVSGVSEEALSAAKHCIEIPQWGTKHSLNISVTVGVVLWELLR